MTHKNAMSKLCPLLNSPRAIISIECICLLWKSEIFEFRNRIYFFLRLARTLYQMRHECVLQLKKNTSKDKSWNFTFAVDFNCTVSRWSNFPIHPRHRKREKCLTSAFADIKNNDEENKTKKYGALWHIWVASQPEVIASEGRTGWENIRGKKKWHRSGGIIRDQGRKRRHGGATRDAMGGEGQRHGASTVIK